MEYGKVVQGIFLSRPNRFVAKVLIEGKETLCHVKNTGRCREILMAGVTVYLEDFIESMGKRKYRYSLISVEKKTDNGMLLINIDSQAPNRILEEAMVRGFSPKGLSELTYIKREYTYGSSRLDFYVRDNNGKKGLIEVKGVTLEKNGFVLFPDAPTLRGIKHIKELISSLDYGYVANLIFIVQMETAREFYPNDETHSEFGDMLREALTKGVNLSAYLCELDKQSLALGREIPVKL